MTQKRPALFISHSSKDKAWAMRLHDALVADGYGAFLDSHPDDGIHLGAKWEKTLWQRLRQSGGVVVLCSSNWLTSSWCVAEAMIAREQGKTIFMLATADVVDDRQVKGEADASAIVKIPDFLKDTEFASVSGPSDAEAYKQLKAGLKKEGLEEDFPLPNRPYPGLIAFQDTDAAVFFGRANEIRRVRDTLTQARRTNAKRFILILGASGCGKSSLVRAGVVPRLQHPEKPEASSDQWAITPAFLGRSGLEGLAGALTDAYRPTDTEARRQELESIRIRLAPARDGDDGMKRAVQALTEIVNDLRGVHRLRDDGCILIFVDQLEEVFGTKEGSAARRTLRLLLDGSADGEGPVVVLVTMRSDFLNAFQQFAGAADHADQYEKITLDPMPRSRFAEIIEGPAKRFGLKLADGLSQRMVEDTKYDDALPLLAYTLAKLYEHGHADGKLTHEEYEALFRADDGTVTEEQGLSAAIKHVADEVLKRNGYLKPSEAMLPAEQQRMRELRSAFYRLADVNRDGDFTRRTVRRSEVLEALPSCEKVLNDFEDQYLLVRGSDADGEATISVAHEALFRVWDTLNGWLRADHKALALRTQIEDAAAEWQAANRPESRAWPDERVLDAVGEIERSGVTLTNTKDRATVDAFLGPTNTKDLEALAGLTQVDDTAKGSGRYGEAWRLPLGHTARASIGVRLAILRDRRKGVGLRTDGVPDIDWVPIDEGDVTIEIRVNERDPYSYCVTNVVEEASASRSSGRSTDIGAVSARGRERCGV